MTNAPYLRLYASILALAIKDARAWLRKHKRATYPHPGEVMNTDAATAFEFILSDDKRPGGFLWICSLLDLNADYIRASILRPRLMDAAVQKRFDQIFEGDHEVDPEELSEEALT